MCDLSNKVGLSIQPVFISRSHRLLISNALFTYSNVVCVMQIDYVGYTTRHLHQRIAEHKFSAIGKHLSRDVPDPDTGIRYPVKFRHPALSGINLPDIYRIVL